MSSSPESFGALAFPVLDDAVARTAAAAAAERGYAAGLARARRRAELERAELVERFAAERAAREAADAARVAAAVAALEAARAAVERTVVPVLDAADQALADGALQIAEAVLGAELAADPDGAGRAALGRVLAHPDAPAVVRVRMHPDRVAELAPAGLALGDVTLVADSLLGPGDAVAELPDGLIDARIDAAIVRARRALDEGAA